MKRSIYQSNLGGKELKMSGVPYQSIGYWYQRLNYTPDTGKLTEADIEADRKAYFETLDACKAAIRANPQMVLPENRQGFNFFPAEPPHFLLSYQHRSNVAIFRRLAEVYRQMFPEVCYVAEHVTQRSVVSRADSTCCCPKLLSGTKRGSKPKSHLLRVGFVSGRMAKLSSVMKDRMGVIKHLDRSKFTVALFSFAEPKDNFGQMAKQMVDEYYLCDSQDFIKTRDMIAACRMDVLVYCELGFGPHTYALAHCRLAPVQVTTWGHSDTSGIPTIDHYISTVLYEVEDKEEAQSHYSENLILHKSLCTHYFKPYDEGVAKTMRGRERFFLPQSSTLYLLIQTPFKIVNRFLQTVASILKQDPKAILIMTSHPSDPWPGERNYKTLERLLGEEEIRRVRVFPWMPYVEAQNLIKLCDVLLDSYPFGGCNTSIESLSVGKPVITMAARFLYGRFTYGFYKKMGIMELVAEDYEDYERLALKVGKDPLYRQEISMKILAASSTLFEDKETIDEWNETMEALASPYVERITKEEAWMQAIVAFHAACGPKAFLWKETLLAFARGESLPKDTDPYQLALPVEAISSSIFQDLTKAGFRLKTRMTGQGFTAPSFFPSKAAILIFSFNKFIFQLDLVEESGSVKKSKKHKKRRDALWSLTLIHGALVVDRWHPVTKWKEVQWDSMKSLVVRTPLRSIIEGWMDQRYGSCEGSSSATNQPWHYEIQVSPSPAHAFFNLKAPYVYTFVPAIKGFGKGDLKGFLRSLETKGWLVRVYLQETYNPKGISQEFKGTYPALQWIKTVPLSMPVDQCKAMVAKDRQDHPTMRPFAIIPPFMSNGSLLFRPQDFDLFVQV